MVVVQNRITAPATMAERIEQGFGQHSNLNELPGFIRFKLLKATQTSILGADEVLYVASTEWDTMEAYEAWRSGNAFARVHDGGGPGPMRAELEIYEVKVTLPEAPVIAPEDDPRYGTLSVFELRKLPQNWSDTLNKMPIRFREIGPDEVASLQVVQDKSGTYPPGDVARRLGLGRKAFVGEVVTPSGNQIVTYGWVAFTAEPLGNTGVSFDPPPGDAYLHNFATVPAFRGKGFYPALLRFILGELGKQGIRLAWISTAPGNTASVHSIKRAGFSKVADINYIPANNGKLPFFELVDDVRFDPALREIASRAYISNWG